MSAASAPSAPVLDAQGIGKRLSERVLLGSVDLSIHPADKIGLVGANGTGKSTFAKILAGLIEPDSGVLAQQAGTTLGYLSQRPDMDRERTALDTVLSGLGPWFEAFRRHQAASTALQATGMAGAELNAQVEAQAAASAEVERLGGWERAHEAKNLLGQLGLTRLDVPMHNFSGGELRRVALAKLFVNPPSLAILDEPTNHLDVHSIAWLERYLKHEFPGALLLITHDRFILDRVVTRTAELHEGALRVYRGGWGAYLTQKAEREAHDARTHAKQENRFRKELDWLRRQPKARAGKSKARVEAAEDLGKKVKDKPSGKPLGKMQIEAARVGKRILELHDLTLAHGERVLLKDLTLELSPRERLGIVGPSGAGKTTLLRALLGEHAPSQGRIRVGKNTQFLYVDQHRADFDESATVVDSVADGAVTVTALGREMPIETWLERFRFFGHMRRARVGSLSGGERARLSLAKAFLQPGNFLLLDEPTNDLDTETLAALEEMLAESPLNVFVVTHDRYFLDRVATAILAFEADGKVVKVEGNYQAYEQYLQRKPQLEASAKKSGEAPTTREPAARQKTKGLTYGERLELKALEKEIAELEQAQTSLEAQLCDPTLYQERPDEAQRIQHSLDASKASLERALERWEALETKRETVL